MSFTDHNECAVWNGNCDHTCNNMEGSYTCACNDGYSLASDRHSCNGKQWIKDNNICQNILYVG